MGHKGKKAIKKLTNKSILSYTAPHAAIAAQFREIRNNIDYACGDRANRSIVVTSPSKGDGKTITAVNLAISKSQRGDKVLIIDANRSNPGIHLIFSTLISPGLIEVLTEKSSLQEAVYSTGIGQLDILPLGTLQSNSVELMDSSAMNRLLEAAMKRYDCVLIDAPAVLDVLDTQSLASKSDGVILVVSENRTKSELALKAKHTLEFFSKSTIIGVVLNRQAAGSS